MKSNLFTHKISIIRHIKNSTNSLGEAVTSGSSAYSLVKARVESYNAKIKYIKQGEREISSIIVYLRPNIKAEVNDDIYFRGKLLGTVIGVNEALKGNTNKLDHYELNIQRP